MKLRIMIASFLFLSSLSFAKPDFRSVDFDLSFFSITDTCEITTSQTDVISDGSLLKKTQLSGIPYFSEELTPTIAWKLGSRYVTNCIARMPNKKIKGDFIACYSRETPIRKYDKSLSMKAKFIDEFCYSEPSINGYYFEYRFETDNRDVAVDASERGRCRYTCIVNQS